MGRRALPKADPSLDLSAHFTAVKELSEPLDLTALFGNDNPVEVEVGSGKGLFMLTASGEHPERNFLGVEVAFKYARHAATKLCKHGRENAIMAHGDANILFNQLLQDASLAAVHVYFPDPWWKARHHKRRIMNAGFLTQALRVLKPGGELHFWTDVQEYFDVSLELIANETPFEGPQHLPERAAAGDMDYHTHFERRTRLSNQPVYRALFRKPAGT